MKILLITEQRDANWNKVSFETLAAAQQIAQQTKGSLSAAVIGKGVAALADQLAGYQLDEVLLIEHDLLAAYTPDGFSLALRQVVEAAKPDLVLFPHTYQVRDFAPKLAASHAKRNDRRLHRLSLRKRETRSSCARCFKAAPLRTSFSPASRRGSHRFRRARFAPTLRQNMRAAKRP